MQRPGRAETQAEAAAKKVVDGAARGGPFGLPAGVGQQWIEGELGALERHGHAVTGERRDHRTGVAEPDLRRIRDTAIEADGGDGAKGRVVDIRGADTFRETRKSGSGEVTEQKVGAFDAKRTAAEEAADVDAIVLDSGEPDVGAIAEVDFKIARETQVFRVKLQTNPLGTAAASAGGEDAAGSVVGVGETYPSF